MNRGADPIAVMHRQWHPRYESRPYRKNLHPSRREHIHGRIQPSDDLVRFGRRIPSARIAVMIAAFALLAFLLPVVAHHG
jgi:hypothetical protein